jgi:glycosyltransferase involved in cell wall biosynthesis
MSENRISEIRVSTIIPVYNGAATIARAIDSALAQDFDGQEIIVVNDGSTDDTAGELAKYGDKIRVINKTNGGAASARNAGIAIARGEFVAFLDADDIWLPGHLSALIEPIARESQAVLAFGDFETRDEEGRQIFSSVFAADPKRARPPSSDELLSGFFSILPSATAVRRDSLQATGGFDEGFPKAGWEDFHLWLLLRERGTFICVNELVTIHFDSVKSTPEKYLSGRVRFKQLVLARYGDRAKQLIKEVDLYFATHFIARAATNFNSRRYAECARDLFQASRFDLVMVAKSLKPVSRLWRFARPIFSNQPK